MAQVNVRERQVDLRCTAGRPFVVRVTVAAPPDYTFPSTPTVEVRSRSGAILDLPATVETVANVATVSFPADTFDASKRSIVLWGMVIAGAPWIGGRIDAAPLGLDPARSPVEQDVTVSLGDVGVTIDVLTVGVDTGGGGGGAVDSVNGQTGVVVLDAADVGAATAAQGAVADSAVQPGDLATVATTGAYADLIGEPTLATVATTGAYADLSGKPTLGSAAAAATTDFATAAQGAKADAAVQPAALAAHETDTTNVHGIADTAALVLTNDARLTNARTPTGAAGGVLAGNYPNPSFAADMATQAELDAHLNDTTDAHDASAISFSPAAGVAATDVQAAIVELAGDITGASVPDGDKGDITVSGSGTTWTIDNGAVTAAKVAADVATQAELDAVAAAAVPTTRTITTTAPLTGGGNLSANRTLAVSAATEAAAGVVELATNAETTTGVDAVRATHPAGVKAAIDAAMAGKQPLDADLTAIAALVTTAYGRGFLTLADQAALVALLPSYQPLDADLTALAAAGNSATLAATTAAFTTADETKLDGIATGATANATDAQLRDRTTHTGAQAISTVTGLQAALDAKAPLLRTVNTYTGTAHTLALADAYPAWNRYTNASPINVTVPLNSTVAFPVGTVIEGVGTAAVVTLVATGGVTINATPSLVARAAKSGWSLVKVATDTWDAVGDFA